MNNFARVLSLPCLVLALSSVVEAKGVSLADSIYELELSPRIPRRGEILSVSTRIDVHAACERMVGEEQVEPCVNGLDASTGHIVFTLEGTEWNDADRTRRLLIEVEPCSGDRLCGSTTTADKQGGHYWLDYVYFPDPRLEHSSPYTEGVLLEDSDGITASPSQPIDRGLPAEASGCTAAQGSTAWLLPALGLLFLGVPRRRHHYGI